MNKDRPSDSKVPVLVVGFNRPDLASTVMSAIARYQPSALYVVCDGPRKNSPQDSEATREVREILSNPEWPCQVFTRFRQENMGLRASMIDAVSWFFTHEESGIILEDDCIPSEDFFRFIEFALPKYKNSKQVWGITGSNPGKIQLEGPESYAFVRCALVWGWASWADRWERIDFERQRFLRSDIRNRPWKWASNHEYHAFNWALNDLARSKHPTSWAYSLSLAVIEADGLWIFPKQNLIMNLGFRRDATHTKKPKFKSRFANLGVIYPPDQIRLNIEIQNKIHRVHHGVLEPLWLNYPRNFYRFLRKVKRGLFEYVR